MRNLLAKSGSRLALTPYLLTGGFFFGKTRSVVGLIYNLVQSLQKESRGYEIAAPCDLQT
jgi:hypothetical protein